MKTRYAMLLLGVWAISGYTGAQSMMVLGGGTYGQDCYRASVTAVQLQHGSFADIQSCDRAIEYGKLALKDLVATYVNRGIIYASLNRLDKAAEDYQTAIKLSSDTPESYLNRGNLWFIANHMQEAIDDYNKAMELELRQTHVVFLNRGMAFESLGQWSNAENDYLSALDISPDWTMAQEKLERVRAKIQKSEQVQEPQSPTSTPL